MQAVICGAGIAGLALAQRLDLLGWDVVVVEKSPGPRRQGYMIDFFGPGYDAAEAMGVLPRLIELGYQVGEVSYLDGSGRRRARVDFGRFARSVNNRLLSILRPDLELALREQVVDGVQLRFGCSITRIENASDGVRVTLTDGTALDADVLVGADGVHSTVLRMVFGEEERYFRYLGFHTAAFVFDDPEIHRQLGNGFCLTDTTQRLVGLYALRDDRVAAFTVHRTPDPALPDDAQLAVRRTYADLGWVVPQALVQCPESSEVYYDQVAQIEIPRWNSGRVTLLGDACQAVSLLGGQGASLAVAGAYVLGDQLATTDSVDTALARYEQLWQPVIAEKQQVARRGTGWFLPSSPYQLWLRRAVLALMRLPGLNRYFGTGLVGKSGLTIGEFSGDNPRASSTPTR